MKAYLTSLSLLLSLFVYIYIYIYIFFFLSLFFFWCRISPTDNFSLFFFSSGVMFHRQLFSLSFFHGTSSNHFLFSGFSHGQSMNKIVMHFLSFSGIFFLSSHMSWPEEDSLLFAPQTHQSVMGSLSQLTCQIFPLCRFDLPTASYHMGFLANKHSAFK